MERKIILTEDGSNTIFVPSLDDHYHSTHGAIQESLHVFINPGFKEIEGDEVNVFELGFGTGLNAFLTSVEACRLKVKVNYTTIEKYPLDSEITDKLNYQELYPDENPDTFEKIHNCEWNKKVRISEYFSIFKIEADIIDYLINEMYNLIYFDAFGPTKQPEMWAESIIRKITDACISGAVFLTYSSRGELKRQLTDAGFKVEHIPGPPGKREITRAIKL